MTLAKSVELVLADLTEELALKATKEYVDSEIAANAGQMSAADILVQLKTVDGVGSGLDAELLNGNTLAQLLLAIKQSNYPIGSTYTNLTNPENPATLLGFGTWTNITDKVIVGASATHPAGTTGGEETHILSVAEMPSHNHTQNSHNHTQNSHNHTQNSHNHTHNAHNHGQDAHNHGQDAHAHTYVIPPNWGTYRGTTSLINISDTPNAAGGVTKTTGGTTATNQAATATNQAATTTDQAATAVNQAATATNVAATATNNAIGGGDAHNNMQPYIAGYMWYRTA